MSTKPAIRSSTYDTVRSHRRIVHQAGLPPIGHKRRHWRLRSGELRTSMPSTVIVAVWLGAISQLVHSAAKMIVTADCRADVDADRLPRRSAAPARRTPMHATRFIAARLRELSPSPRLVATALRTRDNEGSSRTKLPENSVWQGCSSQATKSRKAAPMSQNNVRQAARMRDADAICRGSGARSLCPVLHAPVMCRPKRCGGTTRHDRAMGHCSKSSCTGRATATRSSTSQLTATFEHDGDKQTVTGFYDGDGIYRVRFMPDKIGALAVHDRTATPRSSTARRASSTSSRRPATITGRCASATRFTSPMPTARRTSRSARPATPGRHQSDELEEQTLKTLAASPFNKLRMCVFPKWYTWNKNEPPLYRVRGHAAEPMGLHAVQSGVLSALGTADRAAAATWASRPTSSCCIPTTKGIGASIACRTRRTTATCGTSSAGWPRFATCGGRWPTNTTS